MSPIINQVLRRLGIIAIPTQSWMEFERRFAESEVERLRLAQRIEAACDALAGSEFPAPGGDVAAGILALRAWWGAHATALLEQLSSAHAGGAAEKALVASLSERLASAEAAVNAASAQAEMLNGELQVCSHERELLSLSIGRSEARVKALKRRRDRLAAERDAARRQLAEDDLSGRIRDLEGENHALAVRVGDLERYLVETRGDGTRAYL